MTIQELSAKMKADWDARARENPRYFIADSQTEWSDEEFYALGRQTVANDILTDMYNVCQEMEPAAMRVLEIGCGAGRVTRALSELFGQVDAVDVSAEMVALARKACADRENVRIWNNNGVDLAVLPGGGAF